MAVEAERITARALRDKGKIDRRGQVLLLLAFAASLAVGYVGYQRFTAAPSAAVPNQLATVGRGTVAATVSATGSVVPNLKAQLAFGTSGTVSQVSVALGDKVKAGQLLAKLDTSTLENKVAQAKSSLRAAQIKLEQLKAGATPVEIAAAKAGLDSAQARYDDVAKGATDADIKAAQQSTASAEANLAKAQAELAKLKAGPSQDEITATAADMQKKQAAVIKAQADYDRVAWRGDVQSRPEAVALQQATIDYQAAVANYNLKTAPPKPDDVAAGEKAVETAAAALAAAQARLAQIEAGPTNADLQASHASIASARAQLALKTTPATALDQQGAEEQITQAELAVRQAEIDLAKASLVAPFDGVISAVNLNKGEQTANSSNVTLVNPDSVRVDVSVDETDLSKLALGKTAQIAFDALPDASLTSKVVAISPNATVQQGVVTYLVSLQIDTRGVYLPAGMTANVNIVVDQRDNVLVVPNRAIRTQGRNRVVEVMAEGKPETRPVTIGLSNDQVTEVSNGLQEGEQVVIPSTTTTPSRAPGLGGMPMGGFGGGPVMIQQAPAPAKR